MTQRQCQPLPVVPLNDQNPNFLFACLLRKFGFHGVTFWTKEAFRSDTGFSPVTPKKGVFTKNPSSKGKKAFLTSKAKEKFPASKAKEKSYA